MYSLMKIVDKEKIAQSFLRGQYTYEGNAWIQKKVSSDLVTLLDQYPAMSFDRVLEIGCCTGTLSASLLKSNDVGTFYVNDLVEEFESVVVGRLANTYETVIEPFFGDIESLTLPTDLDLVISSATFQWLADLDALFSKVAKSLQSEGYFVFSIFGPGTLREFKEISGIGLEYASVGAILDLLEKRFVVEEEQSHTDIMHFPSVMDVLKHLQATGVSGVKEHRWTPSKIRKFESEYAEQFGTTAGIPVSYMSSYVVATKRSL